MLILKFPLRMINSLFGLVNRLLGGLLDPILERTSEQNPQKGYF